MINIDPSHVRRAARRLTTGVDAPNAELADARIFRMVCWGARSPRNTNVVFAAVQMLRDLGTIDHSEAAYLFNELLQHLFWSEIGSDDDPDPDLARAVLEGVDEDLIMAAMHDKEQARTVAWYRERGEEDLAAIVGKNDDEYQELCAEGQTSLLDDKPARDLLGSPIKKAAAAPRLAERVLALSATETPREQVGAWRELCEAMRDTQPAMAVPAIRNLRDVGGISFEESLVLIDMAIEGEVGDVLAADRQYHQLQREMDEVDRLHGITYEDDAPDEARPLAWQILRQQWTRRVDGQTAVVLRRFGEHRMANLLITRPEEYARIRDEARIGAA